MTLYSITKDIFIGITESSQQVIQQSVFFELGRIEPFSWYTYNREIVLIIDWNI